MYFSAPEHSLAFEHCSDTVIGDTAGILSCWLQTCLSRSSLPASLFQALEFISKYWTVIQDVLSRSFPLAPNPNAVRSLKTGR